MGGRKKASKNGGKASGGSSALLAAIEGTLERRVKKMLEKDEWEVSDLMKIRDVVREILAERPHEVVVRWVDPWEATGDETKDEPGNGETENGEKSSE